MALRLGIPTYQILKNDDEVHIPSLSSILQAVLTISIDNLQICPRKKNIISYYNIYIKTYLHI